MNPDPRGGIGTEIGATLHDARKRLGLDIREVEDRTKIRTRYLRALENEDWDALPAPAYVRGFLRAYGQVLGLDGEMLADEYRRRHERAEASTPSGATEPVLSEPRRPGERPASRGPLIAGLVVVLVAILLVLGLLGGDGDDDAEQGRGQERRESRQEQGRRKEQRQRQESKPAPLERAGISVEALSTVTLCLIGGSDDALIDSQVLPPDAVETHGGSKRYRLDVVGGSVRVEIADERRKVEAGEDGVSVEADSRGIRSIEYQGPDCP